MQALHSIIDTSDQNFANFWNRLVARDPLQNPLYAPPRQAAHWEAADFADCSFLIASGDEPVFGCSLTLHTDASGRRCLGYFGIEASMLINHHSMTRSSNNFDPEAIRLLQQHFRRLIETHNPDALEYLDPVACGLMSPVTQVLLERGAVPTVHKTQRIDLREPEERLLSRISTDYRELIDWGSRNLRFEFTAGLDVEKLTTRLPQLIRQGGQEIPVSDSHWHTCRELVRQGSGFILQARQDKEETISALFVHNDSTCHYVMDDSLLDASGRPVLQSMLWQAMVRSKQLGCDFFDLGCSALTEHRAQGEAAHKPVDPGQFGGTAHTRLKVTLTQ